MQTGFQPVQQKTVRGDRLIVDAHRQGAPVRDAEILEVLGTHGAPPYRVRWTDDGRESVVYPGSDVHVDHLRRHRSRAARKIAVAVGDSAVDAPVVPDPGS